MPQSLRLRLLAMCCLQASALVSAASASAHPHVFVDGHLKLDTGHAHELTSVTNVWEFDAPFSAFATQGLDANHDGRLSADELKPLARTNMDALSHYHFFTYVSRNGTQLTFGKPVDYFLTFRGRRLTLHFTLPLEKPVVLDGGDKVEVFDPEYFVAFTFPKKDAVSLAGPDGGCSVHYHPPKPLTAAMVAELAAVPASQHDLPPALEDAAAGLAHVFAVTCP